ncbi:uncharacterized protein LOC131609767 [Vicia villosa]|uniref:uncharacterized protein LOC131603562 n=1 Tax=Vicia villosa TaxID=3911 RepID=UPI00273A8D9A|nr:uncharacterized protein LOC131603562 [Vicia villosa]XP_058731903.1 uncharacterized protein LOC131603562 [Vicia villosa]XP_058731904.1 uncharacterized protein LOC131603562 [Vicia villosa]XP_058735923.1 uncharacterized protein LOC131607994 [Vicia villosa]XP_058735924.1 uncharacterized protein LOC131607994 [Vicia villosa]XP_058737542.1 uncharacterized protein LOC131609767 [Vicia villosa]XP_058737543.1 uncharacterized protein LOC131609767 [Vicia villosa]
MLNKERKWVPKQLIGYGGMSSSHSAIVTAVATTVGFQEGFRGSLFATALVLAIIVLNQIVIELSPEHPLTDSRPLLELLGHTPPQVQ